MMGTNDVRLRLARTKLREGRSDEAAQLYVQALEGNPYLVEAWLGLSETMVVPDRAVYCLQRALALEPDNEEAQARLAALAVVPGSG